MTWRSTEHLCFQAGIPIIPLYRNDSVGVFCAFRLLMRCELLKNVLDNSKALISTQLLNVVGQIKLKN